MVMKNENQNKQALIVTLSVIVFFICSACSLMNALYCFSDCIGSIVSGSPDVAAKDALRSLPIFLSFFLSLSGLMVAHTFYRNESPKILKKHAKKHACIGAVLGVLLIVYVIIGLITGRYLSIAEGAPSPIYPLDAVLYALLFIAIAIFIFRYFKTTEEGKLYNGPVRAPIAKKGKFIRCFFRTIWLLIALYGFCGFFYSFFIVDFVHGYTSYSLAVMLVSLVACLSIAVWELYYNNLSEEERRAKTLKLSLILLCVTVVSAVLYFVGLRNSLDGPSNVGFGILPVAFTASVNFATLIVVFTPLIVAIAGLIKGLIRKAAAKK
jgi:hypothetical protein